MPNLTRIDPAPRFDVLDVAGPQPHAMAIGIVASTLMFATVVWLMESRPLTNAPPQPAGGHASAAPRGFASRAAVPQGMVSDVAAQHAIVAAIASALQQFYVDRERGRRLAGALRAHDENGDYDEIATWSDLADRLNDDLQASARALGISIGEFVADVVYSEAPLPAGPPAPITAEMREQRRAMLLQQNCLFAAIETLPRNIGYLKLDGFADASVCEPSVARAMASVNRADALIIDLRDNGGGFGETALQIAGYLFDRPTNMFDPRAASPVAPHTASPVPGNALADKPVYVLTSSTTQSAAEYFVYNLKMLKRARIIGERTAGHQHSGAFHRITDHFGIGIQETQPPPNPYPIKGWEAIGIEPDVHASRDEALDIALKLAQRARR